MLALSFLLLLSLFAVPAGAQFSCNCSREFVGDRIDLVRAPGNQQFPEADVDPVTGRYFLLWASYEPPGPGDDHRAIKSLGRIYDPVGAPLSGQFVFESAREGTGETISRPAAVVYNSTAHGFFVVRAASLHNASTGEYDLVELRGTLIGSNGMIVSPTHKLLTLPAADSPIFYRVVYNRFINRYVVLYGRTLANQNILYAQALDSQGVAINRPVQISQAKPGLAADADIRLDPARKRYAVAWSFLNAQMQNEVSFQILTFALYKAGAPHVVARSGTFGGTHLVYSGKKKGFFLFWVEEPRRLMAQVVFSDGGVGAAHTRVKLDAYFTAVKSNPQDGGFIVLRGRTPSVARLDLNLNTLEKRIYPGCQAGDRNNASLLIYNPLLREFLIVWTYSYWARDGGLEIHARRLKAIPSGSVCE